MNRTIVPALAAALAILGAGDCLNAQTTDPHTAQPERPTVATHAGTVAPGWLELEVGGEFDRYGDRSHGGFLPILAKIGLGARAQLGLFESIVRPNGSETTGVGDLAAGVKWRFTDDAPLLGRFAVLPLVKFPTGSASTSTGTTDVSLVAISSHDLGPVSLDMNAGYIHRSANGAAAPKDATVWTVSFGGPAGGRLGWTAELFGYPRTSGPAGSDAVVAVLFGPTLTIRPWLVLDAGAILPASGPQPRAAYLGATYNVGHLGGQTARSRLDARPRGCPARNGEAACAT